MEERRSERSRKCAELCILDRSEKFGQDRDRSDCLSTSSGRFGNDRMRSGLHALSNRSFKGVFRILSLLIEFTSKIYLYLKYLEFVQKDLYTLFEKRKFSRLFKSKEQCFHRIHPSYKSPHRYSALLSSPSLVKTFSTYFKFLFLANPLPKRQFLGRTISNRSVSTQKKSTDRNLPSFSLFSSSYS